MLCKSFCRILVDITLLVVTVLLMAFQKTGIMLHMLLGIFLLILLAMHNLLHLSWWAGIGQGSYDRPRRMRTALNMLLLLDAAAAVGSGMACAGALHRISALLFFLLAGLHLWQHRRRVHKGIVQAPREDLPAGR